MVLSAVAIMVLATLLGLAMALLTLPGVWLMLLVAGGLQWWSLGGSGTAPGEALGSGPVQRSTLPPLR